MLDPASLGRWRTYLTQETRLSPNTINRMLSAVKRLVKEAAAAGCVPNETAARLLQAIHHADLTQLINTYTRLPAWLMRNSACRRRGPQSNNSLCSVRAMRLWQGWQPTGTGATVKRPCAGWMGAG
jgi:hypothetical protein